MAMLFVQGGMIHPMDAPSFVGDISIKDKKIYQVGANLPVPDDCEIIDASGLHVYPGFIDAHSHIGLSKEKITEEWDNCNEMNNPITPEIRAIDGIDPMDNAFHNALAVGITGAMIGPGSSNVIGGQFAFLKTYGRCVDEQVVKAPSAMKIAFGENPITNYGMNGKAPATRMGVAAMIRKELYQARQYLERNEMEKDFHWEAYRPVLEGNIPLKAHVHRADDIISALRIAREFHVSVTLDHCTEGHLIAEQIAESGFPAIVGPSLTSRSKEEVRLLDFKTPGILTASGVTVAITTDHPVTRLQYLPLCAGLAAKEGLGEEEALKAITINAAKICRVDDRLGSIREGKDADLVIYRGSPLEIKGTALLTIIDGNIVCKHKDR